MKAVVITLKVKDGMMDQLVKRVEDSMKRIENTPGIGPLYLVSDPESNICTTFSTWDTAEQAASWPQNPEFPRFKEEVRPFLTQEPERRIYDVLATTAKSAARKAA